MSDFNRLSDGQKALLKIKLDGYIEAAVQAARIRNIGVLEALSLTTTALVRELSAYSLQRERANEMWEAAANQIYRNIEARTLRLVN